MNTKSERERKTETDRERRKESLQKERRKKNDFVFVIYNLFMI